MALKCPYLQNKFFFLSPPPLFLSVLHQLVFGILRTGFWHFTFVSCTFRICYVKTQCWCLICRTQSLLVCLWVSLVIQSLKDGLHVMALVYFLIEVFTLQLLVAWPVHIRRVELAKALKAFRCEWGTIVCIELIHLPCLWQKF
jgi:hypothetical protein